METNQDLLVQNAAKLFTDIEGIVNLTDENLIKENANKDSKLIPTQRDLVAGAVSRYYALNKILPEEVAKAHISGDIHYHDLDYSPFFPMYNCMLIDVGGMLSNGFKMGAAAIETPKSITTACAITAQIIANVASNIYGGNTIQRIDEVLAPYVTSSMNKYRNIASNPKWNLTPELIEEYVKEQTEKECFDSFQALEYEINTLNTSNG